MLWSRGSDELSLPQLLIVPLSPKRRRGFGGTGHRVRFRVRKLRPNRGRDRRAFGSGAKMTDRDHVTAAIEKSGWVQAGGDSPP